MITYIFVLETNTGATMRIGGLRLLGTLLGAAMACLVRVSTELWPRLTFEGVQIWIIAHRTPYGLVVLYMVISTRSLARKLRLTNATME